jgi:hypothetical protein
MSASQLLVAPAPGSALRRIMTTSALFFGVRYPIRYSILAALKMN